MDCEGTAIPRRKHVMVMPFPAFGHIIPCTELARKICQFHDVTLVVSSFREAEIRSRQLMPSSPIGMLFVDDELNEKFDDEPSPVELSQYLKKMRPHYLELLGEVGMGRKIQVPRKYPDIAPVHAVICDISMPQSPEFCNLGIPVYGFIPRSASCFEAEVALDESTPTVRDEDFFKSEVLTDSFKIYCLDMKYFRQRLKVLLYNTFDALEGATRAEIEGRVDMAGKSVKFIGPLIPQESHLSSQQETVEHHVKEWLNTQDSKSVVYVSFGSLSYVSAEQVNQLGEALLALRRPFIWSLRPSQQACLPGRFQRTEDNFNKNSKYLILPWAPQKIILGHKATAVFVSHCGWNSSTEALAYGIPICAWPMFGDQYPNAQLLSETGTAKIVHKMGMKSSEVLPADIIISAIEEVGGWTGQHTDQSYAKKAAELGRMARDAVGPNGSSTNDFIDVMRNL